MPQVRYGTTIITFTHEVDQSLKHAYITVKQEEGVVLKTPPIEAETAQKIVRKKAGWIVKKLALVASSEPGEITTGSRLPYLGRRYYTKISTDGSVHKAAVSFNYSKFIITLNPEIEDRQEIIQKALDDFYRQRTKEKIPPRMQKWSEITGLHPAGVIIRKMGKRWGSCSRMDNITINTEVIKLPVALIDYVIVHEMVHLKIKRHSREFWQEVGRYVPDYRELDERMMGMRL